MLLKKHDKIVSGELKLEGGISRYVFVCLITFLLIFLLNHETVYTADDYMYHFFWESPMPVSTTRELRGISDLPQSLINHYEEFNGRVVSHAFVMFFMIYDKTVFDICNSLMYLILGILLLKYIENDCKKWKAWYLAVIYLSMWVFLPVTGQSLLWLAGACNYLWMMVLILLFFLPYNLYTGTDDSETGKYKWIKSLLIVPAGLAAGCSNENTGGAIVLLAVLSVGYWTWKKKRIPLWSITGILSACTGMTVLLTAPSSRNRMAGEPFRIAVYLKRIREVAGFSYHYILILLILLFILTFILIQNRKREKREWADTLIVPYLYCVSGAASVAVLLLSPVILGKSWILAVCFMIIADGRIYREIRKDQYDIAKFTKFYVLILVGYAFIRYLSAWYDINKTYLEVQEQVNMIEAQKAQGIMDVEIYVLSPSQNISNATEKTPNVSLGKEDWFNQWMACYYGVDSVTGIEREEVYEGR